MILHPIIYNLQPRLNVELQFQANDPAVSDHVGDLMRHEVVCFDGASQAISANERVRRRAVRQIPAIEEDVRTA